MPTIKETAQIQLVKNSLGKTIGKLKIARKDILALHKMGYNQNNNITRLREIKNELTRINNEFKMIK